MTYQKVNILCVAYMYVPKGTRVAHDRRSRSHHRQQRRNHGTCRLGRGGTSSSWLALRHVQCVGIPFSVRSRMPLVTNLGSDDEGLLELVDGHEIIIRNRSQTKLDDIDTDSDGEDHGSNRAGYRVPASASSKLGTPGKKRLSTGASRRMSMGSVATYGSMPEEYSFDHVGLDGRHTTTMHQPVSVSTTSAAWKGDGQKVMCEMDSVPKVDPNHRRSSRNSDAGSKSSRDISVASLGTTPSYHAGNGPYISKGYGRAPMEDASMESGSLLSPYHAGQGPYIKGSLAPAGSTSKPKKKKSSRSDQKSSPPIDVMLKRGDATGERNSHRSDKKKSSRSYKSSGERSRRSRPKTSSIATQTDISGSQIEDMQSKIDSQEIELKEAAESENKRDSTADEAVHSLDLEEEKEEEDRASLLEQEVVEMKLQLAQAQADLQEAQLHIHRITKERDEALSMKDNADRVCEDLRRAMEEVQDDSRRERLKNQMQGTSSRHVLQKRTSLTSQSAESSHQGSKSGWRHSSITSTGMFGGSSSYYRRGSYASSRGSMASHNNSIGNLSGLLDVQNLSESDAEELVGTRGTGGNLQLGPLKRDMAQQALLDGRNKATDNFEKNGSGSDQEVNDDDPFATVYNKASSEDDEDSDKKRNGPFGFGLMRS